MKPKKYERVIVHPDFKKLLKKEAIDQGFPSTFDFTRSIAIGKKNKKERSINVGFFW